MKTCRRCLVSQPLDNFHKDCTRQDGHYTYCKACRKHAPRPRAKQEYAENKERLRQHLAERRATIRRENPEAERFRRQRQHQRYYTKYRDKILAKNAAYNVSHPGSANKRSNKWAKAHPEKTQIFNATRRARINNAPVVESISLEVLAIRDNWVCHLCKKMVTRKTWTHDHLIPLSQGGDHTYLNIALAHRRCNSKRGTGHVPAQLRLLP